MSVSLTTPGSPGVITAGLFDQLANQLAFGGDINVVSLLGNAVFPLSDVVIAPTDFNNISIVQTGNVVTVSGTFGFAQELDAAGTVIALDGEGQFVATGTKPVPEPGSSLMLVGLASLLLIRRRWK